jgi:hypothetical protein
VVRRERGFGFLVAAEPAGPPLFDVAAPGGASPAKGTPAGSSLDGVRFVERLWLRVVVFPVANFFLAIAMSWTTAS